MCYQNTNLWIFAMTFLVILIPATSVPVKVNKPKSSFNIGPCTWILDRKCPDIDIKFYLYTHQNEHDRQNIYIDESLEKSNLTNSFFNPYHPVKIIIHGYNSDMFLTPLIQMKTEYLQRGSYNLFYVDWSVLAPGPCYPSAVHNTKFVGRCISQLVERIIDAGTSNIHLIGFSLGAHVTNFVANSLKHFKLPRITGLDPAMPLFITADTNDKLDKSDAEFVDIIHTNALVQGKIEQCGHVDFYMNGGVMQPGCFAGGENPFACSHHRAPDYFSESIRSFKGFWGYECASYINYLFGLCPPSSFLVLAGEDCRPDTKPGIYFVTTNHESPFAFGRWTDLNQNSKGSVKLNKPFSRRDPLHTQFDQWGKIEGSFNNIIYFPTPYSQDPNGNDWPYLDKSLNNNVLGDNNFVNKYFLSSNFSSNLNNFTLPVFNSK